MDSESRTTVSRRAIGFVLAASPWPPARRPVPRPPPNPGGRTPSGTTATPSSAPTRSTGGATARCIPGRALTILVKEPWAPDLEVKADTPRPDGFEVLKLNFIRDVPTGIYTYHQMASTFLRRDDGELRKLATSSTEGCGISTAEMTDGSLTTRSYFDGQGERRMPWPEGAVPEDALPAVLRDWVVGEPPATMLVFPSLLAGRFPGLEAARVAADHDARWPGRGARRHGVSGDRAAPRPWRRVAGLRLRGGVAASAAAR